MHQMGFKPMISPSTNTSEWKKCHLSRGSLPTIYLNIINATNVNKPHKWFFIGKLRMHQMGFEPTISPSTHTSEWRKCHLSQGSLTTVYLNIINANYYLFFFFFVVGEIT